MWQEAHARAFTVAKVTRLDILEDIRGALRQAVDEGKTDRWFRQELEPVLKRKGWWGPRDTTDPVTVSRSPFSRAVRGGSIPSFAPICPYSTAPVVGRNRWKSVDDRPYWMYTGINDSHTRRSHLALRGLVLRWDEPVLAGICTRRRLALHRCSVIALSAADVRARGLKVISSGSAMGRGTETGAQRKPAKCGTWPPLIPAPRR